MVVQRWVTCNIEFAVKSRKLFYPKAFLSAWHESFCTKLWPGYAFVNLHEAGGLYLRLYQSFIRNVIGISPASNPRAINSIVLVRSTSIAAFDEGEGFLTNWVVCDLVGVL